MATAAVQKKQTELASSLSQKSKTGPVCLRGIWGRGAEFSFVPVEFEVSWGHTRVGAWRRGDQFLPGVRNLEYRFTGSELGIEEFSLTEEKGSGHQEQEESRLRCQSLWFAQRQRVDWQGQSEGSDQERGLQAGHSDWGGTQTW